MIVNKIDLKFNKKINKKMQKYETKKYKTKACKKREREVICSGPFVCY